MERTHLTILGIGLTVLVVGLVGAMALSGAVGADSPQDNSTAESDLDQYISVNAVGEAEAEPDKATISVAVTAQGDDPRQIRDELATGAEELQRALDEAGVEYETTEYSINQPRHHRESPEHDYEGVHAFTVTLEDPDRVGEIIDAVAGTGAEVGNIQLTLSDEKRNQLRDEAIQNAMDDARQQAETIATAGSLEVTGVISVDATQHHFSPVAYDAAATEDAGAPPTDIRTGDVTVTYNVDVKFEANG